MIPVVLLLAVLRREFGDRQGIVHDLVSGKEPMNWGHCDRHANLETQLLRTLKAFDVCKTTVFLSYGTLIGALRDHGMNPYELDNDLLLLSNSLPHSCKQALYDQGLAVFMHGGVWRVCPIAKQRSDSYPPWYSVPSFNFTDVYPLEFQQKDCAARGVRFHSLRHKTIPFLGRQVLIPEDAEAYLTAYFGDWRHPQVKRGRIEEFLRWFRWYVMGLFVKTGSADTASP